MEGMLTPGPGSSLRGDDVLGGIRCDGDRAATPSCFIVGVIVLRDGIVFAEDHGAASGHDLPTQDFSAPRGPRFDCLGLEILVAANHIIRTVVLEPTLSNVLVLGLLVLIRTFL